MGVAAAALPVLPAASGGQGAGIRFEHRAHADGPSLLIGPGTAYGIRLELRQPRSHE